MLAINFAFSWLNTKQIMSKIGRANEQNRQNLEELQKSRVVSNRWTGLWTGSLDWAARLDYWTDL